MSTKPLRSCTTRILKLGQQCTLHHTNYQRGKCKKYQNMSWFTLLLSQSYSTAHVNSLALVSFTMPNKFLCLFRASWIAADHMWEDLTFCYQISKSYLVFVTTCPVGWANSRSIYVHYPLLNTRSDYTGLSNNSFSHSLFCLLGTQSGRE